MDEHTLLNEYAVIKRQQLESSPYSCLDNDKIDLNPHQIEAFAFAVEAIRLGGAILADEVGLGKTIEAGLVMQFLHKSGYRKMLLIIPSSLCRQWQIEMYEKFAMDAAIVDRQNLESYHTEVSKEFSVVIVSYNFAAGNVMLLSNVKWDLVIFDEAHKLRNVHKAGSKQAERILQLTKGIPKLMLTATPVQNSLWDLYGLMQFIDSEIFLDKRVFSRRYIRDEEYDALKFQLKPIVQRTLRSEVADYLKFSSRIGITVDFQLSPQEAALYVAVNNYLKKEILYAVPASNRALVTIAIRKLLASSSQAVAETFKVLRNRLIMLQQTQRVESVDESLDAFFDMFDDDYEEEEETFQEELFNREKVNKFIQIERDEVDGIISLAENLDIVAHEHYREIVDELRNNPVFRHRNLDTEDLPDMKHVSIQTSFDDYQLTFIDTAMQSEQIASFQQLGGRDSQSVTALYNAYLQAYARKAEPKKEKSDEFQQMSLTEMFGLEMGVDDEVLKSVEKSSAKQDSQSGANHEIAGKKAKTSALKKDEFVRRLEDMAKVAVSVPKITIGYSSKVKFHSITIYRSIDDFEVAASKIERYDVINDRLLSSVDADALMEDDPENFLAAALLDVIPEFCADDADYILDVVGQYLRLIEGDFDTRKKVVRRYATAIVEDLRKQIYAAKEEHTEFLYNVQKELIVFGSGVKNIRKNNGVLHYTKEISDKRNIRQYVFEGYKKSYYSQNAFDSDDERRFSVILEEDDAVLRFIKPPLNQLGLFYKAGRQYNPDFIVETEDAKYMVEVKAGNRTEDADVMDKAKSAIQWCSCATNVDTDHKPWYFKLIPGQEIIIGNTFRYVVGKAVSIRTEED